MTFSEYTLENTPINARPDCPQCAAQVASWLIRPALPIHIIEVNATSTRRNVKERNFTHLSIIRNASRLAQFPHLRWLKL